MRESLHSLCQAWRDWSRNADKHESDWQAGFPHWGDLVGAAKATMLHPGPTEQEERDIAFCWALSEESEVLADFAKDHLDKAWSAVESVASSDLPRARWQAYDVLGYAAKRGGELLRKGLTDDDAYCRRRALISLARLKPDDAQELATRYIRDADPYIRQAAIDMALATADPAFIARFRTALLGDAAWHVREAAEGMPINTADTS